MAVIKPFKGIRPPKSMVEEVASRPYDVLNSAEARAEAGDNEKSLYHIIKPEINFPEGTDEHDPCVYESAAEHFQMFQDKGWLVQERRHLLLNHTESFRSWFERKRSSFPFHPEPTIPCLGTFGNVLQRFHKRKDRVRRYLPGN